MDAIIAIRWTRYVYFAFLREQEIRGNVQGLQRILELFESAYRILKLGYDEDPDRGEFDAAMDRFVNRVALAPAIEATNPDKPIRAIISSVQQLIGDLQEGLADRERREAFRRLGVDVDGLDAEFSRMDIDEE